MKRRHFLQNSAIIGTGMMMPKMPMIFKDDYTSKRPPVAKRNFTSQVVEKTINEIKPLIKDPKLSWMFENCFPNTLDTTVFYKTINGRPDTFVITGDIKAMWQRDSSAQVWPYLPFVNEDDHLKDMIAGVINRQTKNILIDPYANAFNEGPTGSDFDTDKTKMKPELHERKWEIDSLCYPIRLAYQYWKLTNDIKPFDQQWLMAMRRVLQTFREQQRKHGQGPYKFQRETTVATDTQPGNGYGNPVNPVGLIVSSFRPSDDATIFPFLVPSNFFAVASLKQLAEMGQKIIKDTAFADKCLSLADEVNKALQQYAVIDHLQAGKIFAYEVDGFGNRLFMDDSNVPSLLSLPYLNAASADDVIYKNTRNFIISQHNPYYFQGKFAKGNGSPHTGLNMIWPMSMIIRAITSNNNDEIAECISMLRNTDAGTGFMHESFNKDNPKNFTRNWFAWANTLFGELLLKVHKERPQLLKKDYTA